MDMLVRGYCPAYFLCDFGFSHRLGVIGSCGAHGFTHRPALVPAGPIEPGREGLGVQKGTSLIGNRACT